MSKHEIIASMAAQIISKIISDKTAYNDVDCEAYNKYAIKKAAKIYDQTYNYLYND